MFESVHRLIETNAVSEANDLLRDGWVLINTYPNEYGVIYVLGQIGGDADAANQTRRAC